MKRTDLAIVLALAASAAAAKPILVINEDNDHYFKLSSERMNEASLKAYVDDICRGAVTHFFMCPQGQRASFDSKTWEPIWKGLDEPDTEGRTNNIWCVNAKKLFDAGIDPYRVWIARVRERGVSPWMTMRMNDVHFCAISNYFRNTTFHKSHPEWRCVPNATNGWEELSLDYSRREVYDYHLAMAKELLDRYDIDGLELDWMRFTWYFKPGERRRNAHILTDFIRDVRTYADAVGRRRGKRILIGSRVPALPVVCAERGMDVETWAKDRLVDWLVVHNQYGCTDFGIPFVEWRERMKAVRPDLVLLPGCDHKYGTGGGFRERVMTGDLYRGWAESLYAQGAVGLYLFNVPYNREAIRGIVYGGELTPEGVAVRQRRYIASRHDVLPVGGRTAGQLPKTLRDTVVVVLRIGRPPVEGGTVTLAFDREFPEIDSLRVYLNGESPLGSPEKVSAGAYAFAEAKAVRRYRFAPDAFVAAENGVVVYGVPKCEAKVTWCEFLMKH